MKILVISQPFYPDAFAINDIVKGLVNRGHSVTVLTGLPDCYTGIVPKEYKHGHKRKEELFGATVFRAPIIARRTGAIFRSLNYLSFALTTSLKLNQLKKQSFDLIYVWQVSPVTSAVAGIRARKLFHAPLLVYCLDLWPESVKAMGFKEGTFLYNIIGKLSKAIYNKADKIVVSSTPFIPYLRDHGYDGPMDYIPQFAPAELSEKDYYKKPNGQCDFLFIGNMGKAQNLPCLIKAIAKLKDQPNVHFHFVGDGSEYESTKQLAKETGADAVITFYGRKSFAESAEFYYKADACMISLDGSNHIGDTLPGKVQTYMAAGKPIIGAMNGAGREVIQESGCGLCVEAGDTEGLAECFMQFAKDPSVFKDCGTKARDYFLENFTEEKHFRAFETVFEQLVHKSNAPTKEAVNKVE